MLRGNKKRQQVSNFFFLYNRYQTRKNIHILETIINILLTILQLKSINMLLTILQLKSIVVYQFKWYENMLHNLKVVILDV